MSTPTDATRWNPDRFVVRAGTGDMRDGETEVRHGD
jgi:hypothetical protein